MNDAELNMIMKQARINSNLRKMSSIISKSDTLTKMSKSQDKKSGMTSPMPEKTDKDENVTLKNLK